MNKENNHNSTKEEWGAWKIVSDMLDKPDAIGIYPTSECYQKLYEFVVAQKAKARKEALQDLLTQLPEVRLMDYEMYGADKSVVVAWNEALRTIISLIKSKIKEYE